MSLQDEFQLFQDALRGSRQSQQEALGKHLRWFSEDVLRIAERVETNEADEGAGNTAVLVLGLSTTMQSLDLEAGRLSARRETEDAMSAWVLARTHNRDDDAEVAPVAPA